MPWSRISTLGSLLSYMGSDACLIFILVFYYEAWEMHSNFHVLNLWFYNATMKESMKVFAN